MKLFGKSSKSASELVRQLRDATRSLEIGDRDRRKCAEEAAKALSGMKLLIQGSDAHDPSHEQGRSIGHELVVTQTLPLLIRNLIRLDFEARKDAVLVVGHAMRRQVGTRLPTVEYIADKVNVLYTLVDGYQSPEIACHSGAILRECIRHEVLARLVLFHPSFNLFFNFVEASAFDIASDAFSTFKDLLTRHKLAAAEYIEKNYDDFFSRFFVLLHSENYVTRRQSLKLLGEILLDRHNFNVMTQFVCNADNLKEIMNLLRDKSRNIQFEAFHVFKVFVANPQKPRAIAEILARNRDRLLSYLRDFHTDKEKDDQFNDEKAYVLKQIADLPTKAAPI